MSTPLFGSYRLGMWRDILGGALFWGLLIWGGFAAWNYVQTGKQLPKLKDADAAIRAHAAEELGRHGGGRAVEPLIEALNDPDSVVAANAATALGKIKDPRAVDPLMNALAKTAGKTQEAVAEALGKIKDPRTIPLLIEDLKGSDPDAQFGARMALGKIGAPAVEPLIALLKGQDAELRREVALALGETKDQRAVQPLIDILEGLDDRLRSNAAYALGDLNDARAVQPLIGLMKDPNSDVVRAAGQALGKIDDRSAADFLMGEFHAHNWELIALDSSFFVRKGEKGSEDTLIEALQQTGNTGLAEDMLNCGNMKLYNAANDWASKNNYSITYMPSAKGASWGSK